MSSPNYRQGLMAGLIVLVFFSGVQLGQIGAGGGLAAVVASGVIVAIGVGVALLILRSAARP